MKYKAEIFDQFQDLYDVTGFSDHQLHCVIRFQNKINSRVMKKAVKRLIEEVPILGRVYRKDGDKFYWEDKVIQPGNISQDLDCFTTVNSEQDFEKFTCSRIDEEIGPQIKVCLLKTQKDALSIIMSHMVTDGGGFKKCIYMLAELYTKLIKDPNYMPEARYDGDRSFKAVLSNLSLSDKLRIIIFNNNDNNQESNVNFPMSTESATQPFILIHELNRDGFHRIRSYCNKYNATVNDIMLTAYFRALAKFLQKEGSPLDIPIMIDMRRYLKDKNMQSVTNLSSTVIVSVTVKSDETFQDTLMKVCAEMKEKKDNYLGLNTFMKLDTLYKLCKGKLSYKLLRNSLKHPYICMTNIGILDYDLLKFEGSVIEKAFVCGSIKYRPHFQMAISSFNDTMTLSVNLHGSQQDRDNISRFFKLIDEELKLT